MTHSRTLAPISATPMPSASSLAGVPSGACPSLHDDGRVRVSSNPNHASPIAGQSTDRNILADLVSERDSFEGVVNA